MANYLASVSVDNGCRSYMTNVVVEAPNIGMATVRAENYLEKDAETIAQVLSISEVEGLISVTNDVHFTKRSGELVEDRDVPFIDRERRFLRVGDVVRECIDQETDRLFYISGLKADSLIYNIFDPEDSYRLCTLGRRGEMPCLNLVSFYSHPDEGDPILSKIRQAKII